MRGAVHFRGGRRGVLVLVLREYGGWRLAWCEARREPRCTVLSVVPVVSRRRVAASSAVTPPASARIPPARGVREPPRGPRKPAGADVRLELERRDLHTSTLIITPPHTICYNSKSHTSLTHTHSKCIALSTQARPEPAETVCRSARHENASNSDTTHSTACLGHTHKPLTRPPRAGSWVSVRYLELNRPTLVRSSASLPSPAATRRASPSSACA